MVTLAIMLSLTPPKLTIPSLHRQSRRRAHHHHLKPICSSSSSPPSRQPPPPPPQPPPGSAYLPFRPPPSPLPPQYRDLPPSEIITIIRDRLGLWHDYAALISSLSLHYGFTPPSIEDSTGLSSVDQNRFAVASRVRLSLLPLLPPDLLPFFDSPSSADSLYSLRLLNASQRAAAAARIVRLGLDSKSSNDLARAIKDFPRRRGEDGWDHFSPDSPGDCLAFSHFRLSRESLSAADTAAALEKALSAAETERARKRIEYELDKASGGAADADEHTVVAKTRVPVVRLKYGEVAEAASVALLPVCKASAAEVEAAPRTLRWERELGVVAAEKGWERWVVLPGWAPVLGIGGEGGVAVEFAQDDARRVPWRMRKEEGGVLAVVDRKRKEVADPDGFYLVGGVGKGAVVVVVEKGKALMAKGVEEALGSVVLVVRQPMEEDDQLADEDWD